MFWNWKMSAIMWEWHMILNIDLNLICLVMVVVWESELKDELEDTPKKILEFAKS